MKNVLFLIYLFPIYFFGQDNTVDSLKLALKNAKHDTTRLRLRNEIGEAASIFRIPYWDSIYVDAKKLNVKKMEAAALNNIGFIYNNQGDISKVLEYYHKSLKIEEEIGNKEGIAISLNNIGLVHKTQGDIPKALEYFHKSLKIYEEIGNKKGVAISLNNLGLIHKIQGDITKAIDCYHRSLVIKEEMGDKEGIAISLNNLGLIYKIQGNISKALEYYHKSLKLFEELSDKKGIANSFNNIGLIYESQDDLPKALEYYRKSLKIKEESGDKKGMATTVYNIGLLFEKQDSLPKALEYIQKSLKIREDIQDKQGVAFSLNALGTIYEKQGDKNSALENYQASLKIREDLRDKQGIANSLMNIGRTYSVKGDLANALIYTHRSMKLAKDLGFPDLIKNSAFTLKQIYLKQNKFKEAFEMYELEMKMRDSINNQETQKASIKKQMQYTYEKQAAKDSVEHAKENDIKNAEITARKAEIKVKENTQFALYCGLIIVIVFAGFMFNRFKVTQKQKHIIEIKEKETLQQKYLIEEKHKEITDSINYAERIQRSFLATKSILTENLNEHFVFFQPKDVVSGDFYWASILPNGNFALVTADSTGHGVPGAIMSILNITSLEKSVHEERLSEPGEILNHTRTNIIKRLKLDGSSEGGKDGMDCSIISFDKKKTKLIYSGANNPVWIVRQNELIELDPDKMPVGKHDKDFDSFTQQEVLLQSADVIYALTDGYPDQFGGPKGKKFMYKKLKELLVSIATKSMAEQKEILSNTLKDWKGDTEQVDDVCVIGIRV